MAEDQRNQLVGRALGALRLGTPTLAVVIFYFLLDVSRKLDQILLLLQELIAKKP